MGPDGELVFLTPEGADDEEAAMIALLNQLVAQSEDAEGEPEVLAEDEIWREIDGGHLLHLQSGAICASEMGSIARERELVFAPDGSDVGCNYADSARHQSYLTMYVYHRPHDAETEWQDAMLGLRTRQPGAEEVPFGMPGASYAAATLAYETADGTLVRSSLLLAQENGWFLKMRITCPADECLRVEQMAGVGLMGQMERVRMGTRAPDVERAEPT